MAANAHERAARAEKVTRIVSWLHGVGANPERLDDLTDQQWQDIARLAGVNPPSAETRRQVIAAMQPVDADDPFVGLPR